ncbi:hypothetical protein BV25DRAFT_1817690 [Artomyces pyxidatus]|uniref:Uncharacterized protein n=1 Tax=Artomyces pyxidatus TaxID=48021 RepID=A0ACB8TK22_9AGAM|nr:hypothetical protein BV25DRAFT_1817690 [Artomyces pyxidatus]
MRELAPSPTMVRFQVRNSNYRAETIAQRLAGKGGHTRSSTGSLCQSSGVVLSLRNIPQGIHPADLPPTHTSVAVLETEVLRAAFKSVCPESLSDGEACL